MADEIKGGLDQTGEVENTIPVTGVSIPGVGKVAGKTSMQIGPEVLTNMQKLIDQKYGGVNSFLNPLVGGLKDAAAILSGGTAMTARDAEKRAEEQQFLQMQNTMAALKGQQLQQAAFAKQRAAELGIGGGQPAAPGAPSVQGVAPQAAPAQGSTAQMISQFPEMREALAGAQSEDEYNTIKRDFIKKIVEQKAQTAYGPTSTEMVDMPIGGKMVPMTRAQASKLAQNNPIVAEALQKISGGTPIQGGGINPQNIGTVESGNRPYAVGPNVPGQGTAKSSMQVMDNTALNPGYGVKPAQLTGDPVKDEAELKRVGEEYFNALKAKHGDTLAAVAYNWGPGKLEAWLASGADVNKLPADVRDYVAKAHLTSAIQNRPVSTAAPSDDTKNIFGDKAAIAAKQELEKANAIESGKANIQSIKYEEAKLLARTEPFELQTREGNNQY